MLQEAISKLQNEMEENKDNTYTQLIGDYLIKFVNKNQEVAVMEKDKLNDLIWKRKVFMSIMKALENKVLHLKNYIKDLDRQISEAEED